MKRWTFLVERWGAQGATRNVEQSLAQRRQVEGAVEELAKRLGPATGDSDTAA